MAGRGGFRPGSGRKPKRLDPVTLSPIRIAELTLAKNLPALVDVALQLALDGDRTLLVYCIDRVLGRTIQPISIETQVAEIATDFGVEPERVTSIIERLKARQAG
jgi:hypothetical protein